jgi:hypothetical protein
MIFLGLDLAKVNWPVILYILVSILFIVYGTMKIYSTGQSRGIVFAIGSSLTLLYFGLRWFGSQTNKPKNWPPIVNMCPDYLTYLPKLPGCVDLLGVTTGSAGLTKTQLSEMNSVQLSNRNKVFEYTSADIQAAKNASDLQPICDRCQAAGVTWEGVYDGEACVGISTVEQQTASAEKCLASTSDFSGIYNA